MEGKWKVAHNYAGGEVFNSGKPVEVYTDMMDAVTMALLEVAENPSEAEELIKLWRRDQ